MNTTEIGSWAQETSLSNHFKTNDASDFNFNVHFKIRHVNVKCKKLIGMVIFEMAVHFLIYVMPKNLLNLPNVVAAMIDVIPLLKSFCH